jgi:hypothetical protein
VRVGLTYCGDPDAFYGWPVETQERVLGWLRAQQPKQKRKVSDRVHGDRPGRAFWGLE